VLGSAISGFTVSPYSPCCFQEQCRHSNPPNPSLCKDLQNFTLLHFCPDSVSKLNVRACWTSSDIVHSVTIPEQDFMDTRATRARIRQAWEEEATENLAFEQSIERTLNKWRLAAVVVTLAFGATCVALVPFLGGHSRHGQWESVGKKLLILAIGLFNVFVFVVPTYWNLWSYRRDIRKIHKRYAPPQIKYKKR
jgi:hypothetical protein